MKKIILLLAVAGFCFVQMAWGQEDLTGLRKRVKALEQRVTQIEAMMTQETDEENVTLEEDEIDPLEPGEIKIIKGTPEVLDNCDSDAQWSVESGAGVTIEVDESNVYEGTGSIKVTIPPGVTAIIKATKSAGSWDISTHKYLKVNLYKAQSGSMTNCNLHFGEAIYSEQNMGVFTLPLGSVWLAKSWDISAIDPDDRDAVTMFAVTLPMGPSGVGTVYIDYVFADPGPSAIKAFDGDRVIHLYPKILTGHYHATGSQLVVPLARKGTPSGILFFPKTDAKDAMAWQTEFGTSIKNLATSATVASILTVADGSFTVEANANINVNTQIVSYIVMWDD